MWKSRTYCPPSGAWFRPSTAPPNGTTIYETTTVFWSEGQETKIIADFEDGLPSETDERQFAGQTLYRVVESDTGRVLSATAEGSASGLVFPVRFDPAEWPWLEWRWKIDGTVRSGDARVKHGDDYAARVYVVFPHWLPLRTRSINYIWANRLPRGAVQANTFTANAMMIALQSGDGNAGEWVNERRNLADDYRLLFGDDPPDEALVALMSDSDQTQESVQAWYDDIRLVRSGRSSGSASTTDTNSPTKHD